MGIVGLILGILLLVAAIGAVVGCICRTPENLRGWYGVMYVICSLAGIIGGIALIIGSLF